MRLIANALWSAGKLAGRALCTLAFIVGSFGFTPLAASAQANNNLPPVNVYARAYNGWQILGQQANTYTFNGGACNFTPFTGGNSGSFFVFSGSQAGTTVYFPVYIQDVNPSLSEIVTPTSTVQSSASCGFAASTTNQHTTFTLSSGTAGLQEAIASQVQGQPPFNVLLDTNWYQNVYGLPGSPTPESLITAAKGNTGVQVIDTTTSPWTYWRWNGTAYAATAFTGGASLPTIAAGVAAGTTPTVANPSGDGNTLTANVTSGTSPTTGALFTETWATSNAFLYPPVCRVWNSGANTIPITYAVTWVGGNHAVLTVSVASAPVASTAYQFKVSCQ